MTKSIAGASWLTMPETQAVIAALEAARPGCARFVGGCVRNHLMGGAVDDIDIATQLEPDETVLALEAADIRAIPTGVEHGTVTAVINGRPFEITSLRRDVETDGRRAVVAFTQDWAEDAMRRDFRLNALYAEPNGTLHDPTEGGLGDAASGAVIFIGDADERLREDYLRILRFFRFNAWYGAEIDEMGLAACARQKNGLEQIAAERIWKELKKLLSASQPGAALLAMEESGVLAETLPGAGTAHVFALITAEMKAGLPADPMRRLMAMIVRRKRDVAELASGLRLSNAEAARLEAWSEPSLPSLLQSSEPDIRAAFYRYGSEACLDRAITDAALHGTTLPAVLVRLAADWQRPSFPVNGDDALEVGLSGPAIGEALRKVESDWIDSDFQLSRDDLLKRLVP